MRSHVRVKSRELSQFRWRGVEMLDPTFRSVWGRVDVVDAPMKPDNKAETRQKARSINWIEC